MVSTFDGISEPSTQSANDEFSYQNSRFHNWVTHTFSSSYNRTFRKLEKCKRYVLWKWKVLLVSLCLWLSVAVPVFVLWHELKLLRTQISNNNERQFALELESHIEGVKFEDYQDMSSTTTDTPFYSSSSTLSYMENIESILDRKLLRIKGKYTRVNNFKINLH